MASEETDKQVDIIKNLRSGIDVIKKVEEPEDNSSELDLLHENDIEVASMFKPSTYLVAVVHFLDGQAKFSIGEINFAYERFLKVLDCFKYKPNGNPFNPCSSFSGGASSTANKKSKIKISDDKTQIIIDGSNHKNAGQQPQPGVSTPKLHTATSNTNNSAKAKIIKTLGLNQSCIAGCKTSINDYQELVLISKTLNYLFQLEHDPNFKADLHYDDNNQQYASYSADKEKNLRNVHSVINYRYQRSVNYLTKNIYLLETFFEKHSSNISIDNYYELLQLLSLSYLYMFQASLFETDNEQAKGDYSSGENSSGPSTHRLNKENYPLNEYRAVLD